MEFASGNTFFRFIEGEKDSHQHNFDHTFFCIAGKYEIALRDHQGHEVRRGVLPAGGFMLIERNLIHKLTELEPGSHGVCIYAHRWPQSTDKTVFSPYGKVGVNEFESMLAEVKLPTGQVFLVEARTLLNALGIQDDVTQHPTGYNGAYD